MIESIGHADSRETCKDLVEMCTGLRREMVGQLGR